jgi:hypothetical protein
VPGHRCHGAPERFDVLSEYIAERYGRTVRYIADVAGGQGALTRVLRKRHNYEAEVVDPRGWTLKGVPCRDEEFHPGMASYYDLVIGLHPDEATRAVAGAAVSAPAILVPCCNFWDRARKLGRDALLDAIEEYYAQQSVVSERVTFGFSGPMNVGLVSQPPGGAGKG